MMVGRGCGWLGWLVGLSVALGPGGAVWGRDRQEILAQQKSRALEAIRNRPLMAQHRLEELFSITADGDDLAFHALITPLRYYEDQRAELQGVAFPALVLCREMSHDIPDQIEFEFTLDDWSDPQVHAQLHIQSRPGGELQVEKTWYTPAGERSVMFTQFAGRVHLRISSHEGSDATGTVVHLSDASFAALRRAHRAVIERYLRPLFHEVRQDAAFAPDPRAAWQVLADDWPVDETIGPRVRRELPALDDSDFRVRAEAADAIYKLCRGAAGYILHMDQSSLAPEQRLRLDEVTSRFKALPAEQAARLHDNVGFLIDCLYCDDLTTRKLALARLRKLTAKACPFDLDAGADKRIAAVNALRQALCPDR
jgi:hypothetical protein